MFFCTELQLERQCLYEQQQQLELHHCQLTATAESLTRQLRVMPDAVVVRCYFSNLVTEVCLQAILLTFRKRNAFKCYTFRCLMAHICPRVKFSQSCRHSVLQVLCLLAGKINFAISVLMHEY